MKAYFACALAGCAFLLPGGVAFGQSAEKRQVERASVAQLIDGHVAAGWQANKVKPAGLCSDATFLRRVYLDLTGRIPPVTEVRDFLDDPDPDKRPKLVRRLLAGDQYARFSATVWHQTFIPPGSAPPERRGAEHQSALGRWLAENIKDNTPYNKLAAELIGGVGDARATSGAAEFAAAAENKPENLAAATARVFLGVKIECAQCHDHPFAGWKRQQFWEFAAFFARGSRPALDVPGGRAVEARFLDGVDPKWREGDDPRRLLADWVTRPDNPYFARAAVNRVWARFLGYGLVDPVDEFGENNPASHPELLDELSRQFVRSGYDLRLLTEGILTSKTYQQASDGADARASDSRLYARRAVRGLMPEQVYDNLVIVSDGGVARKAPNQVGENARAEFVRRFQPAERPTDAQTSVLQSLYRMNGPLVAAATRPGTNPLLKALGERAADKPDRCVEELYLLTLSRRPTADERERMVNYVKSGGPDNDPQKALADVLWVLLNSAEFSLSH